MKKIKWIHIRFTYSRKKNSSHLEAVLKFRSRKQKLINRTEVSEIWRILLCFFKLQTQNNYILLFRKKSIQLKKKIKKKKRFFLKHVLYAYYFRYTNRKIFKWRGNKKKNAIILITPILIHCRRRSVHICKYNHIFLMKWKVSKWICRMEWQWGSYFLKILFSIF